jgi:hypothetical protein
MQESSKQGESAHQCCTPEVGRIAIFRKIGDDQKCPEHFFGFQVLSPSWLPLPNIAGNFDQVHFPSYAWQSGQFQR